VAVDPGTSQGAGKNQGKWHLKDKVVYTGKELIFVGGILRK
jgi:hypothetical protein